LPSLQTRKRLVRLVISKGFSIGKAARKTRVKLSTAKMIVKRFRTSGDFFESKKDRAERQNQAADVRGGIDEENEILSLNDNPASDSQVAQDSPPLPPHPQLCFIQPMT
jgi:transposase-like protein